VEALLRVNDSCLTPRKAFQGINPFTFQDSSSPWLSLVDGGSNLEQIPLGALFTKERAVDVIVAVDASADDPNQWPKSVTVNCVVRMAPRAECITVGRRFLLLRIEFLLFSLLPIKHFLLFHPQHRTLSPRESIKDQHSLGVIQVTSLQSTL